MTTETTTKILFYNGVRLNSTSSDVTATTQPIAPSMEAEENNSQTMVTTKRLSLVQDFINQVWYGFFEIKSWHKKNSVYIVDLAPVAGKKFSLP